MLDAIGNETSDKSEIPLLAISESGSLCLYLCLSLLSGKGSRRVYQIARGRIIDI
jgi:hypothetical protein